MATIEERYAQKFGKSMAWYERGQSLFAGGITHQTRFTSPFPAYIDHADGPYKYDVDDNQIIDYVMGNGCLLMGHNPPEITQAVAAQAPRGTHLGGATTHEVRYAEAVKRLMPSLERIRFTCSGTESTYLALRLARAYTGKTKLVKFHEHYHGWHDYAAPESGQGLGGVPQSIQDEVIVAPTDAAAVDRMLTDDHDIAAVIVESNGAHYGTLPLPNPQFLQDMREVTAGHGVVFIMDEVVTGFRLSPGGAQVRWGIEPDLSTMAKIVAGGQPGGAVGGRADIMQFMAFTDDPEWDSVHRVSQGGTFNAQPITAIAGTAMLEAIATRGVNARADAMAQRLKEGLNEVFRQQEISGHAHGIASIIHVTLGVDCDCDRDLCPMPYDDIAAAMPVSKTRALRRAMLVNGVDMMGGRAFLVSSAHDEDVIDQTVAAFSQSLQDLKAESAI
ncbi:MAG: aminotransferase class III-fold pyridoxal phosphate-dependent enzyme [Candidatus Tectomicrobia bacterium]|nr:aminotransferase class III-fold pyridoxal phosphate-dependent enzyme [Candidatus Tectomicrobia bacterium]